MENQLEIWKKIPEYEGLYEVSNLGRIKSFHHPKERILKSATHARGYRFVVLVKGNKKSIKNVHRLVLIAFTEDKPQMQVNHKNAIKSDNRLENLEWMTAVENMQHAWKSGLIISHFTKSGYKRTNGRAVQKIDPNTGIVVKEYIKIMDARKDGYQDSGISMCVKGKQKFHKGYKWKYKYEHNERYDK